MALVTSHIARCVACGASGSGCTSPGHRDEDDIIIGEEIDMTENRKPLKSYDVVYNGHKTRMKLSEEDAKRLAGTPVGDAGAEHVAPAIAKARTAQNK